MSKKGSAVVTESSFTGSVIALWPPWPLRGLGRKVSWNELRGVEATLLRLELTLSLGVLWKEGRLLTTVPGRGRLLAGDGAGTVGVASILPNSKLSK